MNEFDSKFAGVFSWALRFALMWLSGYVILLKWRPDFIFAALGGIAVGSLLHFVFKIPILVFAERLGAVFRWVFLAALIAGVVYYATTHLSPNMPVLDDGYRSR